VEKWFWEGLWNSRETDCRVNYALIKDHAGITCDLVTKHIIITYYYERFSSDHIITLHVIL